MVDSITIYFSHSQFTAKRGDISGAEFCEMVKNLVRAWDKGRRLYILFHEDKQSIINLAKVEMISMEPLIVLPNVSSVNPVNYSGGERS